MSEISRLLKIVALAVTLLLVGTGRVLAGSTPPSSVLLLDRGATALIASGVLGTDADGDGADDTLPPIDCDDGDPNLCCVDIDGDGCDDCTNGFLDDSNDGTDNDADGFCDATDCNDSDNTINPGATEIVDDGIDQDCSGTDSVTCFQDADTDGYGSSSTVISTDDDCTDPGESPTDDGDCNDSDNTINPGATEIVGDGVDQDCDAMEECFADADTDGFGSSSTVASANLACTDPGESATDDGDCNDSDNTINPGATEIVDDGIDQDCSGTDSVTCFQDADTDGYGSSSTVISTDDDCTDPGESPTDDGDCNDSDNTINPGATEIVDDGIDQDCSGTDSVTCFADADTDGYGSSSAVISTDDDCTDPGESATDDGDCDDSDSAINPGATEIVDDGIDQDCSGTDSVTCFADADTDGYGSSSTVISTDDDCTDPGESPTDDGDCNDSDNTINPGATETPADGIDQDCDLGDTCFLDADTDGFGSTTEIASADLDCTDVGESTTDDDCDDANSAVHVPPVAPTSAASDRDNFCADDAGNISLSVMGGSGTDLRWFDDSCGGTDIGTGNPLVIASPTATTTYFARWENSCSNSTCANVTVSVVDSPTTATVGADQNICANDTTTGLGGNTPVAGTGLWSVESGGTGNFTPDATTPNATFTHTGGAGPLVLRWTISNPPCADSTAELNITITQPPSAGAGAPQTICEGQTVTLAGTTLNSSGCTWTTSGDGSFNDVTSLTAVYTPGANDISSGTVDLTLTCSATAPCTTPDDDTMTVTINPLPDDSLAVGSTAAAVCPGTGTNVTVDLSEVGVNYQLRNNAGNVNIGPAVPGTGGTIMLPTGPITAATTFNVLATNATTNCSTQLLATQAITLLAGTSITTHPANANAVLNPPAPAPSASFSVVATGTNLTYQWQQSTNGGTTFTNVTTGTGATTASYSTAPVAVTDSGKKFRCVVTGDCGVVNSNAANLAVQDASGVSNATEDAGPNNGDGNGDGIPDSQQANVTSLPNQNGVYVTLETPNGTQLAGVVSGGNPSPGDGPAGVEFPAGFTSFMVTGVTPGGATTVKFYLPVGVTVNTYYKYGIEPGNGTPHWYEFNFDGTTGAEVNGNIITLHFVDGQRGDKDLTANGIIDDPGAPASKEGGAGQTTPTNPLCLNFFLSFLFRLPICGLGCGMAIVATFAGLVGMKFSRRRRVLRKR